ncbi:MAG: hypothetical protein MKZ84_04725 [Dehalococcoidia bacterium]|nr:hypothetical protein [Dehalococcoidia bacterium]
MPENFSSLDSLTKRLNSWFDKKVSGPPLERRVVGIKQDKGKALSCPVDTILVSRFEPKFVGRIDTVLDCLPEILDVDNVRTAYKKLSEERPLDRKTLIWRDAVEGIVVNSVKSLTISPEDADLVRAGLDSVLVILDTVLWSAPLACSSDGPRKAEKQAFIDVLELHRARDDQDVFRRYFGDFEGYRVITYCPGSMWAHIFLAIAWEVCTGERLTGLKGA